MATLPFQPTVTMARVASLTAGEPSRLFMRLDFPSVLDGKLNAALRPPLDIALVVDISGSMGCTFPDDVDGRSKLCVAKACINKIVEQLGPLDRVSIIAFNTDHEILVPLRQVDTACRNYIQKKLNKLCTSGGTALAQGLQSGYDVLQGSIPYVAAADGVRLQRVFFLTDMESSAQDEQDVIAIASAAAGVLASPLASATADIALAPSNSVIGGAFAQLLPGSHKRKQQSVSFQAPKKIKMAVQQPIATRVHVSLVGIGVDLSVATVEAISAIPGAKYMSVMNAAECLITVAERFVYDVTPLAVDINLSLSSGLVFKKVYGSAELNSVVNSPAMTISAEFPEAVDTKGCTLGGLYLCELTDVAPLAPTTLTVNWKDLAGQAHACTLPLTVPAVLLGTEQISVPCDDGLRKAVALMEYVRALTIYALADDTTPTVTTGDDDEDSDGDEGHAPAPTLECPAATLTALQDLKIKGIVALASPSLLPIDTPPRLACHLKTVITFRNLRQHLLLEMAVVQDSSLDGSNKNVMQTVDQVLHFQLIPRFPITMVTDHIAAYTSVIRL